MLIMKAWEFSDILRLGQIYFNATDIGKGATQDIPYQVFKQSSLNFYLVLSSRWWGEQTLHWGSHPGGALWELMWRNGCSSHIWLLQSPKHSALCKYFCVYKSKTFRLTAVSGKCQDSHCDTPQSTIFPLTPFFDIFSWAGFSHHWKKQLMQKNTSKIQAKWVVHGMILSINVIFCARWKLTRLLVQRTLHTAWATSATSELNLPLNIFITVPLQKSPSK